MIQTADLYQNKLRQTDPGARALRPRCRTGRRERGIRQNDSEGGDGGRDLGKMIKGRMIRREGGCGETADRGDPSPLPQ